MATLPLSLIAQAVPRLSRHDLEALTERLIDRLDTIDGDPDEEDATDAEDEGLSPFAQLWGAFAGPGCRISDPKEEDDPGEDNGDTEPRDWPTFGAQWELSAPRYR